jgi:hypothetical protein
LNSCCPRSATFSTRSMPNHAELGYPSRSQPASHNSSVKVPARQWVLALQAIEQHAGSHPMCRS